MKKIGFVIVVLFLMIFFIFSPQSALEASKQGLTLWFTQILPALLPFSILSYIVLRSNLFAMRSFRLKKIQAEEWYVILCGFLFGFPVGSKLTADMYREGWISKKRAGILSCFTNNLSPVFVTTMMQNQLLIKPDLCFYLLLYGIPFVYGMIGLLKDSSSMHKQKNTASRFQITMQIVDAGIINGFETLIKICGYIMMFSILTKMLWIIQWRDSFLPVLLTGCMEVTNGMSSLGKLQASQEGKYLLAILFLSFNGISGLFQTASILSKTDLSVKHYCRQKLLLLFLTMTGACLLLFVRRLS